MEHLLLDKRGLSHYKRETKQFVSPNTSERFEDMGLHLPACR